MHTTPNTSPTSSPSSSTRATTGANAANVPANGSNAANKGKGGAPKGNKNAMKNATRINHKRLVVGELPPKMVQVKREAQNYRRELEAEVLQVKGNITTTDAHLIDTATAATMQAGICRWLLRNRFKEMSTSDIRGCTADMTKAKERRDAAIKALGLNAPPVEPWVIDAPQHNNTETD